MKFHAPPQQSPMSKKHYSRGYRRNEETVWREWSRRQLIRRDGMVCGLCKEPITSLSDVTIDHIDPRSKGGSDKLENLRLAHEGCNRERGAGFFERSHAS